MDNLTPRKLLATVVAVSAVVSALATAVSLSYFTGAKPTDAIREIVREGSSNEREISERILRQDELVVGVVKRISPAVVSVVATKDVPVVEQFFVNPFEGDPFLERFFGEFQVPQYRERGTEERQVGAGTGFVVSSDGLILTNKHVVADTDADYTVFLNDGTKLPARVLARDPFQDLAVLKVDRTGLTAVTLGDSDGVEIGQSVIAIGNALGEFRNAVSVGVVSGLGRTVVASGPGGAEELQELIQTDAAINPGNSGGPLLNLRGEVIGINTAMARGAENIGFAIPINRAKRDIKSVKTTGRIVYPFLGIRYVLITKGVAEERRLPLDYGVLILSGDGQPAVVAGSPAAKAGLRDGDIIFELDGERILPTRTLATLLAKHNVGDTVTLAVRRGGETLTLRATLDERK